MAEGFAGGGHEDIFDGGPTVAAEIDSVRTIRDARAMTVTAIAPGGNAAPVASGNGAEFRSGRDDVTVGGGIDPELAGTPGLALSDPILAVAA